MIVKYVENNYNKITPEQVHYLPNRAAIRENNETTKLQIVFDASSKAKGKHCLNNILYSGLCLLPYLYDITLQFRARKFRLVPMSNKRSFKLKSQKASEILYFLWFKNINDVPLTPSTLQFTRVVFGLPSSPFLLSGTTKYHLEKHMPDPNFTEIIKKLIVNLLNK